MRQRLAALTVAVFAGLLAGCAAAAPVEPSPTPETAPPTQATPMPGEGTVRTSKYVKLSLRADPTQTSRRLTRIPNRTAINLACKTTGTMVSNGSTASNMWNKVTYKTHTGYVASVYVTGGDSPELALCQDETPTAPSTPVRPPNVEPAILTAARGQLGVTERKNKCNPYGGCMAWSSLYAAWVWNKAGDTVPKFSFSGDLYSWGRKHNRAHDGVEGVGPGDMVLTGTGPQTPKTSKRVDIVVEVLPDGRLKVIGGDVKKKVAERVITTKGIYAWVDA